MSIIFNSERGAELKSQLEVVARLGAILLIALYVSGFLVVTFADASRGFVSFGLFRAKILTAGVLFTVFLMLPLLDWSRAVGTLGFPKIGLPTIVDTVVADPLVRWFYSAVLKLFYFFLFSWGMSFFLCLYVLRFHLSGRFMELYFAVLVGGVFALVLSGFQFRKHALACILMFLFIIAAGTAGLVVLKEWQIGLLMFWFLLVGYVTQYIEEDFRKAGHPRNASWHWVLLNVLALFIFFSRWLYPKITPSLGGGQPTQAIFQFLGPSPIDNSVKNNLWLLDEVDNGYYVLKDPNERKAIFIPRGLVSAIYFDADQPDSSKAH